MNEVDPVGLAMTGPYPRPGRPTPPTPPFPTVPGGVGKPSPNNTTILGFNFCICPSPKSKRLKQGPVAQLGRSPRMGPASGTSQYFGPLLPGQLIGAGGCHTCIGVVISCPQGNSVHHFREGGSLSWAGQNWYGCHAIVCGGDDSRGSNCLADAVLSALNAA